METFKRISRTSSKPITRTWSAPIEWTRSRGTRVVKPNVVRAVFILLRTDNPDVQAYVHGATEILPMIIYCTPTPPTATPIHFLFLTLVVFCNILSNFNYHALSTY